MKKTNEIFLEAPRTSDNAVERARVALKVKKDNTFSDEEIIPTEVSEAAAIFRVSIFLYFSA